MYSLAEYEALRATIRERGSVRICLILVGLIAWGALALALNTAPVGRAVTLVPLLVLVTTFEVSVFVHTAVERVGRYLQVYYEDAWESAIMAYARDAPAGPDPLFVKLFALVIAADFFSSLPAAARHPGWIGLSLIAHLALGWRLTAARRRAAQQRTFDLERFRELKETPASA